MLISYFVCILLPLKLRLFTELTEWLERSPLALKVGSLGQLLHGVFHKLSIYSTGNGYPTLFRAEEGEGGEEEE